MAENNTNTNKKLLGEAPYAAARVYALVKGDGDYILSIAALKKDESLEQALEEQLEDLSEHKDHLIDLMSEVWVPKNEEIDDLPPSERGSLSIYAFRDRSAILLEEDSEGCVIHTLHAPSIREVCEMYKKYIDDWEDYLGDYPPEWAL